MKRSGRIGLAVWMLAAGGCASRGNVELLESQLRRQEDQLHWANSQLAETESDLTAARRELEALRVQMAERGNLSLLPEQSKSLYRVTGVRVQKLFTGGLDRDGLPGDELLNVVIVPHDEQGETVKLPGDLEIEAIDLTAPEGSRKLGIWSYTAEEVSEHWHSGLTSGFQFRMPWHLPPRSENLVLNARYQTADGRKFGASAEIRVIPVASSADRMPVESEEFPTLTSPSAIKSLPPEPIFFVEEASASEISLKPSATLVLSGKDQASEKPPIADRRKPDLPQGNELFPIPENQPHVSTADDAEFFPPSEVLTSAKSVDDVEFFPTEEPREPALAPEVPPTAPVPSANAAHFELPQVSPRPAENPPRELVWKVMDEGSSEAVPSKPAALADGFRALKPLATKSEQPENVSKELDAPPMRYQRSNREFAPTAIPRNPQDQKPRF